ncbi:erythromycin esterase family protein [Paenibacillus sp. CAA11]|uniref:erythromycin esterase family protein n=1 Tax=Paenibacillus sp. CAA11 TaxID=1532905 RepID=UPI001F336622|nr:erythromycin esterase family protein [Paenibacillus sp. CAA11]
MLKKVIAAAAVCSLVYMAGGQSAYMAESSSLVKTDVPPANQAEVELWRNAVRSEAKTITTIKPGQNGSFADLNFLKTILADKRIVSLGEASHGASEYNSMKVRLVQYLHEELGYNVIAFESNLGDMAAAYAQIHNKSPEETMKKSVIRSWQVEENLALFEYIAKQRNTEHPLILTGFDAQGTSEPFIDFAEQWFAGVDPKKAEAFAATERWYFKLSMISDLEQFNAQKDKIKQKYNIFQEFVKAHRTELSKAYPDQPELVSVMERILQNRLDMLDSYHVYLVKMVAGIDTEKQFKELNYERDRVMASNVAWLADTAYPNEKIIIWGHNYHVRKSNSTMITEHNGYDYDSHPYPSMGEMLPLSLKKAGYVIGLYAYQGSSNKSNGEAEKIILPHEAGSVEDIFGPDQQGAVRFFDMKNAVWSKPDAWMFTPRIAKAWGVLDEIMIPREQYDGILFFDTIHPSHRITAK